MTALPDSIDIDLGATELTGRVRGDTLTVTIHRPEKKNALTADGYHGIKRAAMIVADEPDLGFLVLTGVRRRLLRGRRHERRWKSGSAMGRLHRRLRRHTFRDTRQDSRRSWWSLSMARHSAAVW